MARKTQKVDTMISQIHDALSKHIEIMHINVKFTKVFVPKESWDVDYIYITVFYFTNDRQDFDNVTASSRWKYLVLETIINEFYRHLKIDDPNNNIEYSF